MEWNSDSIPPYKDTLFLEQSIPLLQEGHYKTWTVDYGLDCGLDHGFFLSILVAYRFSKLQGGGIESVECSTGMEPWNGMVEWTF